MGKKQHYVPKAYLSGFCSDKSNQLWRYDISQPNIPPILTNITNLAQERYFYGFEDFDGKKYLDLIEESLNIEIESDAHKILNKKIYQRQLLSPEEKHKFSRYLSLMLTRVPKFRQKIKNDFHSLTKDPQILIENLERMLGGQFSPPLIKMANDIINKFHSSMPSKMNIPYEFEGVTEMIFVMHWDFWMAPHSYSFIVSDNPFWYTQDIGFDKQDSTFLFPISKNCILRGSWRQIDQNATDNYLSLPSEDVQLMNKRQIENAFKYIFCNERTEWVETFLKSINFADY